MTRQQLKFSMLTTLTILMAGGCSKSLFENEVSRSTGLITDREVVEVADEKPKSKKSLTVSNSKRSRSGVGFGLSFTLPFNDDEPETRQVSRFTVLLPDGSERQIDYSDDDLFIDDCIDIIEEVGGNKPPELELSSDSCEFAR